MQLRFGSAYNFEANAVLIAQSIDPRWNEGGQILSHIHKWSVRGSIAGTSQADLTAGQLALVAALKRQDLDLIFYQDDGSESATTMKNRNSITGVKIMKGPYFTSENGSEYASERTFSFEAEAEYPVAGSNNLLISFREKIETSGGQALYIHRPCVDGPPQKQMLYKFTPYAAVQSGTVVGYRKFPTPPSPWWPAAMKMAPRISETSPNRRDQNQYESYQVDYTYEFESVSPLSHYPALWN